MTSALRFIAAVLPALVACDAARAEPAQTTAMVNMRVSPGAGYSIVNILPSGAVVNAHYCLSNDWCRVEWRGTRGWVNSRYLRTGLRRKV